MTLKIVPLVLAAVLIVVLTLAEARFSDRFHSSNIDAAEFGARFKNVPMILGSWKGEDQVVEEDVRKTAGAVNYVSRMYNDSKSGRQVTLWLIVGHARDVCRHTPNICYPSAGFKQESMIMKHHIPVAGGESAVFYTARFEKTDELSRHAERVFWAWNHPDQNRWEAPDNQRIEYGNSRVLYKLYFTSNALRDEETIDDNISVDFAELMLPYINAALFPEASPLPEGASIKDARPDGGEAIPDDSTEGPTDDETQGEPAEEKSVYDSVS